MKENYYYFFFTKSDLFVLRSFSNFAYNKMDFTIGLKKDKQTRFFLITNAIIDKTLDKLCITMFFSIKNYIV